MRNTILVLCTLLIAGCAKQPEGSEQANLAIPLASPSEAPVVTPQKTVKTVHVLVALCDNVNQGIIPVPATLGNGDDPKNNLYWGAMYGTKSFLKRSKAWTCVAEETRLGEDIIQRVIFKHSTTNVYLVADAYRGASIKQAVADFLDSAAGHSMAAFTVGEETLGLNGQADLLVYVGHNGLMDFSVKQTERSGGKRGRDAIVLACKSKQYFQPRLSKLGCRSVLLTTGLMAPEAYTLEAAVEAWLSGGDGKAIHERAARAYHRYQKCGLNGARRLFFSEE
jgi:hypothetical protein